MIKIKTKLLNENNFNKYGTAILKQNQSAPKVGENWDCWGGIANLGTIDGSNSGMELTIAPSNSKVKYVGVGSGSFYKILNPADGP